MGWSGTDDLWYNLPIIDCGYYYNNIYTCFYNIYAYGSGEIIAGRVTDGAGNPVSGAVVTATGGYATLTDYNGVYALAKVPSATTFTVSAALSWYTFTSQEVATGTSANNTNTTGNKWGIDFVGSGGPGVTLNDALDNSALSFTSGGGANWFGEQATWTYGGSAAQSKPTSHNQSSWLQTTVVGPGAFSFQWKVSGEEYYDTLDLFIDGVKTDSISGNVNWTTVTKTIPAGIHDLKWQYSKDESVSAGCDCGWVDQVVYVHPDCSAVNALLLDGEEVSPAP